MVTVENPPDTYLNSMIDALRGIWEAIDGLTEVINNANTNRSQEAEAICERLDDLLHHLEAMD